MDTETLVRISPLISGPLLSQRNAIKTQIVRATLSRQRAGVTFTVPTLRESANQLFGLSLDEATLLGSLEQLETEDVVAFAGGATYRLKSKPELASVTTLFADAWGEFSALLAKRYKDYDPHWTDAKAREVFEQVILSLFAEIAQTGEYLSRQIELLGHKDFDKTVDTKLRESSFSNPKAFKDALAEYLSSPTPVLSDLFSDIYRGIINFDILLREAAIPGAHIEGNIRQLFLDTNVIAALLTQSDRLHLLAGIVCRRSAAMGIELVYSQATSDELRALILGSEREMRSLRPGEEEDVVRSQFVGDFLKSGLDWGDYSRGLENWEETVRVLWNVKHHRQTIAPQIETYTFAKSIIPEMNRLREEDRARRERDYYTRERRSIAIEHDAVVLGQIATLRADPACSPPGPFFLTFDNVIAAASEAVKNQFHWEVGPAIQPRSWLNYLLAFTPALIEADRRREVAKALIGLVSWPSRGTLTIEEYARLVAPKVGLKVTDVDILVAAFSKSPLRAELESALEKDKGSEADRVTKRIIENRTYIETIAGTKRKEEVIRSLRTRLDAVEAENRVLRQDRAKQPPASVVVVNITNAPTSNAVATAQAESTSTLDSRFDLLIDQLTKQCPGGWDAVGLAPPPNNRKDGPAVRSWLKKVFDKINDESGMLESAKNLLPTIALLLSMLPRP